MTSATNAAALANLGALPLTGGTLTGALTLPNSIFTGLSLTGSQATNTIDVSTTWNTTGAPALFYGRATNTASGATAKLMSLGTAAGGELFAISKLGAAEVKDNGTDAAPSFSFTGVGGAGAAGIRYSSGSLAVIVVAQGSPVCAIGYQLLRVGSTGIIGWSSAQFSPDTTAADLSLSRAAAASLQLGVNNATTATNQTIKAHNVTTGTGADLILSGGTGSVANGNVRFGTHSAIGAELVTGFITIKDASGTLRKLAVVS